MALRGTVRVGGIEPLAHLDLALLVARLARGRPNVTVRLDVGGTAPLSTGVADGRLAFALCSSPPPELDLVFDRLFREPIGLVLPARHELARSGRAVGAPELVARPVIVAEAGLGVALLPLAGLDPAPPGTVIRLVDGVDLGLDVGIVRPRAGEPYSALTSQVLTAVRSSAPRWRTTASASAPARGTAAS